MENREYLNTLAKISYLQNYEQDVRVPYQSKTFDLDQFKSFLHKIGSPHHTLKTIMIAGTVGKGATGKILEKLLISAGYTVGFFSSPHLWDIRERIRYNGQNISQSTFLKIARYLEKQHHFIDGEHKGPRTFFEFLTALAIIWYSEKRPDYTIFEVGVGGRLDATNVFRPLMSIITPIGIDHCHWLGKTKTAIAAEKAGIIHPGARVISAYQNNNVREVIQSKVMSENVEISEEGRDFKVRCKSFDLKSTIFNYYDETNKMKNLVLSMVGSHQVHNAGLALRAAVSLIPDKEKFDYKTIQSALSQIKWPGRTQCLTLFDRKKDRTRHIVLDGAHNSIATQHLVKTMVKLFPQKRITSIVGYAKDKDYKTMLKQLSKICTSFILTKSNNARAEDPDILKHYIAEKSKCFTLHSPEQSLLKALETASDNGVILVTGSLYLVGQITLFLHEANISTLQFEKVKSPEMFQQEKSLLH